MKIALIGYGKMGHAVEQVATERGHEVVCRIDKDNTTDFESAQFRGADIAIEFSVPQTAVGNVERCFAAGVPVVCGTTGWDVAPLRERAERGEGTLLWSSNYSIGVNIFFALNRRLAQLIGTAGQGQYEVSMKEIHHVHKLDAPSGTAKTLAQAIEQELGLEDILIESVREGEVPGTHIVRYESGVDEITIEHVAKSRTGFALGAVVAAEAIVNEKKKGWIKLQDILNL